MLWDNQHLYGGFVCWDDNIWTAISHRDEPIYNDQKTYIELEVKPMNRLFDGFIINKKGHQLWN